MSSSLLQKLTCPVCEKPVPELTYALEEEFRQRVVAAVQQRKPDWTLQSGVCSPCLNYFQNLVSRPGRFRFLRDRLRRALAERHHPSS